MGDVVPDTLHLPMSSRSVWQLHFSPQRDITILSIDIDATRFRVGRRENANLTLASPQISGFHAEFIVVGLRLFVRDLASTNGTYVNGKRIGYRDVPLRHGDQLRMANVEFTVQRRKSVDPNSETAVMQETGDLSPAMIASKHDPASIFD